MSQQTSKPQLITQLRTLLNASLDTFERELKDNQLPEITFDPTPHPLDNGGVVAPPRLYESRKVAISTLGAIAALIKPAYYTASVEGPYIASIPACFAVAAEHEIANVLADKSVDQKVGLNAAEIANKIKVKIDPDHLARVLRVLCAEHVFTETSENVFANNRLSLALMSPSGSRDWAILASKLISKATTQLPDYLEDPSGGTAFARAFNEKRSVWEWLYGDPKTFAWFCNGMAGIGEMSVAGGVADYPWDKLGAAHLVDVGGGQGSMSFPILAKYPKLRVTIQDLETVLPAAQQNLTSNWSQIDPSRVAYQTMDFFETNPTRGEDVVYMARWILHDWDDKDALRILKALRASMSPSNKFLIFDSIITPGTPSTFSQQEYEKALKNIDNKKPYEPLPWPQPLMSNGGTAGRGDGLMDMTMLSFFVSQERTQAHLERLLTQSNLKLNKVYRTRSNIHIAEVVVA